MAVAYAGTPKKVRAPQWQEINYATTPAKRRERTHQRMVMTRQAGKPYDPYAPAKMREKKKNRKAKRRYAYKGEVEAGESAMEGTNLSGFILPKV